MTGWVAIQRNPTSGSGPKAEVLKDLIRRLKEHGLRPRLFSRRERLAQSLADPQRREQLSCLVAAGGDGTVDDVVNRFPGVPMTVCPLGTENLFAKYLGIPRSGRFVADTIAAGKMRRLDLCTLQSPTTTGTQRFLIMAGIGFDAEVVRRTHARRRGHIRKHSYVIPILQSFFRYGYPPLRLFVDGSESPLTGALAVVSNLPMYALQLPFARSADASDGLLDVRLFERPSRRSLLRYAWNVWRGRHESLPDVRSIRAKSLRVEADVAVPVQVDGDPAGTTPVEIGVLPAALTVLAPPPSEAREW